MSANELESIAKEINEAHDRCLEAAGVALHHAIRAGELLTEVKENCSHGQRLPWLKANCRFSKRTAQGYMRLHRDRDKITDPKAQPVAHLGVKQALRMLAEPKSQREVPADFEACDPSESHDAMNFADMCTEPEEKLEAQAHALRLLMYERRAAYFDPSLIPETGSIVLVQRPFIYEVCRDERVPEYVWCSKYNTNDHICESYKRPVYQEKAGFVLSAWLDCCLKDAEWVESDSPIFRLAMRN